MNKPGLVKAAAVLCVAAVGLLRAFDNGLRVRRYRVPAAGPEVSLKIAHLSDLHGTEHGAKNRRLIAAIAKERPGLIAITGDLFDLRTDFAVIEAFVRETVSIAPVYYVPGNHEFSVYNARVLFARLAELGVHVLSDASETAEINGAEILIGGIEDPDALFCKPEDSAAELLAKADNPDFKGFKLLLSHRPELWESYMNTDFDLILAGHAHGGQMRIPRLLNGLYAPNQGFFPKYAGGAYTLGPSRRMIVSRGLGISHVPRIFNPPELVIAELTP